MCIVYRMLIIHIKVLKYQLDTYSLSPMALSITATLPMALASFREILKSKINPEILKNTIVWHQRISNSSFRSWDIARNPQKIHKSILFIFWKSEKSHKSGGFDTSRSPLALFVLNIYSKKKSRNPIFLKLSLHL